MSPRIHGQTYLRRRVKSPGHFQQETRNAFRRGLAPKQNHPFPGRPELPRTEIAQRPGQVPIRSRQEPPSCCADIGAGLRGSLPRR